MYLVSCLIGCGGGGGGFFTLNKSGFRGCGDGTFFALFILSKVVTNGDGDLFDGLFAYAGDLAELFGGHVGERFNSSNAGGDQLLHNGVAELDDLLDGSGGSAAHGLHLLLYLLALLLFALDVDLPLQELGGKADVLALLADGKRELGVVNDDFDLLFGEVRDGDARDFGGLQCLLGEGGDLVRVLDDVDLFAAQFADDRLHTHALHADAGTDGIDVLVPAHDSDLAALTGLAGDSADRDSAVVDLGDFRLEERLDERRSGTRDDHLWALCGAINAQKDDAHTLADGELFEARLLALGHPGLGLAEVEDDVHGLEALDGGGKDLASAVRILVEDGVALGLADLLKDDLLGHLCGDAAERRGVLVEAELAADLNLGRELASLLEGELVVGVFNEFGRFNNGLVDVGADLAGLAVHLAAHVFDGLVELAGREGDRILDRANHDLRVDALFAAQNLNRLIQSTCHVVSHFFRSAMWVADSSKFCCF